MAAAGVYNHNAADASATSFAGISQAENTMNPSDVNNAMRAHDASFKRWLLDLGGTGTVGGTATAITLAANEASYTGYGTSANQIPNGGVIALKATSDASAATTLNINSIGTKKILFANGDAIAAGAWVSGDILLLRYDSAADSSSGAWLLLNPGKKRGTWTPALKFGGNSVGMTYTAQSGRYVKDGRTVHVWMDIILSAKGSSTGAMTITGLPFTVGVGGVGSAAIGYLSDVATGMRMATVSGTTITCYGSTGAALTDTAVTSDTARIIASITFEADA